MCIAEKHKENICKNFFNHSVHHKAPTTNANNAMMNQKRTLFLIFLALSLEKSLRSINEEAKSPKSVIATKGINQKETSLSLIHI